jgi:hypothetical protein
MLLAGVRNAELRGLRVRDFARAGFIEIPADVAKGGRPRTLPVVPELQRIVDDIRASATRTTSSSAAQVRAAGGHTPSSARTPHGRCPARPCSGASANSLSGPASPARSCRTPCAGSRRAHRPPRRAVAGQGTTRPRRCPDHTDLRRQAIARRPEPSHRRSRAVHGRATTPADTPRCPVRRGRDSNPRTRLTPVTRFPVAPVQPLRHLSRRPKGSR